MITRISLVACLVSLFGTAGCTRGSLGPSAHPVVAYQLPSEPAAPAGTGRPEHPARFDGAPTLPRVVDPGHMEQPFASRSAR